VKKAAARANRELGVVPHDRAEAIIAASDEIIACKLHEHFTIDMIQGGAGTFRHRQGSPRHRRQRLRSRPAKRLAPQRTVGRPADPGENDRTAIKDRPLTCDSACAGYCPNDRDFLHRRPRESGLHDGPGLQRP
jgi:hypothetical protein